MAGLVVVVVVDGSLFESVDPDSDGLGLQMRGSSFFGFSAMYVVCCMLYVVCCMLYVILINCMLLINIIIIIIIIIIIKY